MANMIAHLQSGKAVTERKTFSRQTSVSIDIKADPAVIWALLTNAADMPRWNPTIVSIEGEIAPGAIVRLRSALDGKRIFRLTVTEFEPAKRLAWGDGKGKRVFELVKGGDGVVRFKMSEKISGLMFPLYAKYIPPFDRSFEEFAMSLKKEAELINQ